MITKGKQMKARVRNLVLPLIEVEMYLNLRSVMPGAEKEVQDLVREVTDCEVETVRFSPPCFRREAGFAAYAQKSGLQGLS